MKKYQMPNVESVQINAMQVIMESPIPGQSEGNIPWQSAPGAPKRAQ